MERIYFLKKGGIEKDGENIFFDHTPHTFCPILLCPCFFLETQDVKPNLKQDVSLMLG